MLGTLNQEVACLFGKLQLQFLAPGAPSLCYSLCQHSKCLVSWLWPRSLMESLNHMKPSLRKSLEIHLSNSECATCSLEHVPTGHCVHSWQLFVINNTCIFLHNCRDIHVFFTEGYYSIYKYIIPDCFLRQYKNNFKFRKLILKLGFPFQLHAFCPHWFCFHLSFPPLRTPSTFSIWCALCHTDLWMKSQSPQKWMLLADGVESMSAEHLQLLQTLQPL